MAFLRLIARDIPVCCPPGIEFEAFMRFPSLHPVLDLPPPHLPTCSPHCEKVRLWPSPPDGFRVCGLGRGMLNVCTGLAESQVEKEACWCEAKCPSSVAAPVSSLTQTGVHSPS